MSPEFGLKTTTGFKRELDPRYTGNLIEARKSLLMLANQRGHLAPVIASAMGNVLVDQGLANYSGDVFTTPGSVVSLGFGLLQMEAAIFGRDLRGIKGDFIGVDAIQGDPDRGLLPEKAQIITRTDMIDYLPHCRADLALSIDGFSVIPPYPRNLEDLAEAVNVYVRSNNGVVVDFLSFPASVFWGSSFSIMRRKQGVPVLKDLIQEFRGKVDVTKESIYMLGRKNIHIAADKVLPYELVMQALREDSMSSILAYWDQLALEFKIPKSVQNPEVMLPSKAFSRVAAWAKRGGVDFHKEMLNIMAEFGTEDPYDRMNAVGCCVTLPVEVVRGISKLYDKHTLVGGTLVYNLQTLIDAIQVASYTRVMTEVFRSKGLNVETVIQDESILLETEAAPLKDKYRIGVKGSPEPAKVVPPFMVALDSDAAKEGIPDTYVWVLGTEMGIRQSQARRRISHHARVVATVIRA